MLALTDANMLPILFLSETREKVLTEKKNWAITMNLCWALWELKVDSVCRYVAIHIHTFASAGRLFCLQLCNSWLVIEFVYASWSTFFRAFSLFFWCFLSPPLLRSLHSIDGEVVDIQMERTQSWKLATVRLVATTDKLGVNWLSAVSVCQEWVSWLFVHYLN